MMTLDSRLLLVCKLISLAQLSAVILAAVVLDLSALTGPAVAQASWMKFCNIGEGDMVYRKIVLGRTSASRSEVVMRPGACGPNETGFPAAYAFFSRDKNGLERNVVYQNPATRIEAPENLDIEQACFNPRNRAREVVTRGFANEFWLGDKCRPGQRMARITFVVLGIRGAGTMTYNLAKPDFLPASIWFDGGAQKSETRKSDVPNGALDPAEILLRPFLVSEILPAELRSLDNIAISDLPRHMTLSPSSNEVVSVMIDGHPYGLVDLVHLARKTIVRDIKEAGGRGFHHIFNRPLLLRTDDGGHAVIYADMRRKTLIAGAVGAGALESHIAEYGESNPLLKEFFASSFFTDPELSFRFNGMPREFVQWKHGGMNGVYVTQLADSID